MLVAAASGTASAASSKAAATLASAQPSSQRSASDGKIVFRRWLNDNHSRGEIFTINRDGTGLVQVTHTATGASTEPDPSPDGRWIDYMVIRNGDLSSGRLFKIHPGGSGRTPLSMSCTGTCVGDGFPDWSSSGLIAFQRTLSSNPSKPVGFSAIFVMSSDGTHVRQITLKSESASSKTNRFYDESPGWSPSGATIAFDRGRNSDNMHAIFTVKLDGSGLRRITPWKLDASQPQYSPSGKWIAFRSCEGCDTAGNLYLVHPDGSTLHQLTHTAAGKGKWQSCGFSPSGKSVVSALNTIVGGNQQNAQLYIVPAGGGSPQKLFNDSAYWDSAADWGTGAA